MLAMLAMCLSFKESRSFEAHNHWPRAQIRGLLSSTILNAEKNKMTGPWSTEEYRKFRRTVYTFKDWREHRTSGRYRQSLMDLFTSGVARALPRELSVIGLISAFVVLYNGLVDGDLDFFQFPSMFSQLELPALPFVVSSPALGLLLVFRTTSCYMQWWEARKCWGGLINRCRDFARNALCYFEVHVSDPDECIYLKRKVTEYTIAFTRCLKGSLREGEEEAQILQQELIKLLGEDEANIILEAKNKPLRVIQELSSLVKQANIPDVEMSILDRNISFFCDTIGICERIFKTPLPLAYTRLTSRFLAVWLLLLPLALWRELSSEWLHIGTIPACVLIALFFLGIEELGLQIEEPFGILPLEAMGDAVEKTLFEMLANDRAMNTLKELKNHGNNNHMVRKERNGVAVRENTSFQLESEPVTTPGNYLDQLASFNK